MLTSDQLVFFKSALPGSGGGVITDQQVPENEVNNLFDDTPWQALRDGQVVYKKIFLKNLSPSSMISVMRLWLLQPTDRERMAIGFGTSTDTDGSLVTYQVPTRDVQMWIPEMQPGDVVALWLRKTTDSETPDFLQKNYFQIALSGEAS